MGSGASRRNPGQNQLWKQNAVLFHEIIKGKINCCRSCFVSLSRFKRIMVLGQIMARWTQNSLVSTVTQPGLRSDKGSLSCPPRIATFQMICTHPTLEIRPQDFAGHDLQVKLKPVVTQAPSNHMNSWTQELFKLMIWTHCQNRHPDHIEGFPLVCIDQSSTPPGTGPLFTPGVPSECALHPIDHLSWVPLHWGWGRGWAWDCSRFPADYLLSSCGLYEKESFLITPGSMQKHPGIT